jgi:drug/metabolite transporter (DMT)-like permease
MWSTARSAEATYAFHGWFDLFASALGSFGWLLFAISQLHGEDGQIIGIAAVVVNAFGFAFYATYIVVKLAVAGYMGTKVINTPFNISAMLHFNQVFVIEL